MGVITSDTRLEAIPPVGTDQGAILAVVGDELRDKGFMIAQADKLFNWARSVSLWPIPHGLANCAIEMMQRPPTAITSTEFFGQVFAIIVLTVAAAEAAIGLAVLIV